MGLVTVIVSMVVFIFLVNGVHFKFVDVVSTVYHDKLDDVATDRNVKEKKPLNNYSLTKRTKRNR